MSANGLNDSIALQGLEAAGNDRPSLKTPQSISHWTTVRPRTAGSASYRAEVPSHAPLHIRRYLVWKSSCESSLVAESCASDLPSDSAWRRVPSLRMFSVAPAPTSRKNGPNRESCAGMDHCRKCREHNCQTQGHWGSWLHRAIVRCPPSRCGRRAESLLFDTFLPYESHSLETLEPATNLLRRTRRIADRILVDSFSRY